MAKDKIIMVVKRELLFKGDYFQGFREANRIDYESRVLDNFQWMSRNEVEPNPDFKQPIAYTLIINPELKRAFAYQRSKQDSKYPEKRLQGKWSFGIGGHIEKPDIIGKNPIHSSMLRELQEEVETQGKTIPVVLGYINDDKDSVGKVHFGILYAAITNLEIIKPKDLEIAEGRLRSLSEIEKICSNPDFIVEGWSQIALEPLRKFLA